MEAVGETGSPDATNGMGWAWRAAWREACDSAWDAGVRWSPVDTERGIADRIAECLEAVTPEGESDFGAWRCSLSLANCWLTSASGDEGSGLLISNARQLGS